MAGLGSLDVGAAADRIGESGGSVAMMFALRIVGALLLLIAAVLWVGRIADHGYPLLASIPLGCGLIAIAAAFFFDWFKHGKGPRP